MSEWISVGDRLPEASQDVLVWCSGDKKNYFMAINYLNEYSGDWGEYYYVTHWMMLPEPPK